MLLLLLCKTQNDEKLYPTDQEDERLKPQERCSPSKTTPPAHATSSDGQVRQSHAFQLKPFPPQVKFALEAPKGGEMFECKSKAEARMMAIPMFDITELLANGNSFEADKSHTSQKGTIQADD